MANVVDFYVMDTEGSPNSDLSVSRRDFLENKITVLSRIEMFGAGGTGNNDDLKGVMAFTTNSTGIRESEPVERMRIHTNGYVGIGTTEPKTPLHIPEQGLQIGTTSISANNFHVVSDFTGNSRGLRIFNGNYGSGTHLLTVLVNGSVGIGTTSPGQKLHVSGGNAILNNAFLGDVGHGPTWAGFSHNSSASTSGYGLLQRSDGLYTLINKKSGGGYLGFRVDNSDKMIINDSGNVGIGTTSPGYKLDVAGDIRAQNAWLRTTGNAGWYSDTYAGGWYMTDTAWVRGYNNKGLWMGSGLIGCDQGLTIGYGGAGSPSGGAIIAGNVGIGTPSTGYKLEVVGNALLTGNYLYVNSESAGKLRVGAAWGMPGLYSGDDGAKDLILGVPQGRKVYLGVSTGDAWVEGGTGNTYLKGKVGISGDIALSGKHAFRGNDSWLRLNQDGAFTSGVHTPGVFYPGSLNVGGAGGGGNPGWGNVWITGNVGIGTTSLAYPLDVNGKARVSSLTFTGDLQLQVADTTRIAVTKSLGTINFSPGNIGSTHPYLSGAQFVIGWNQSGGRGETVFYQHGDGGWRSGYDFWTERDGVGKQLQARIEDTGNFNIRGTMGSISDVREKTKVQPISNALKKILNLRGVYFNWLDKDARDSKTHLGLIAQEVKKVVPEVVAGGINEMGEEELLSLHYDGLIPLVIEALKEQQQNIDALSSARSGSDFAEYFLSADGKAIKPGTSVVLEKDAIRPAKKGEVPIGVISVNPGLLGGAYLEWPGKYIKDDFGAMIMEEYKEEIMVQKKEKVKRERQKMEKKVAKEENTYTEIVFRNGKYRQVEKKEKMKGEVETPVFEEVDLYDKNGKEVIGKHRISVMETYEEETDVFDEKGMPVMVGTGKFEKKTRPKLNPEYDETKEYVSRDKRPEWNCVGLIGQLPLRKGQPVAPTWVKVKDISDKVELWLVK